MVGIGLAIHRVVVKRPLSDLNRKSYPEISTSLNLPKALPQISRHCAIHKLDLAVRSSLQTEI